MDILFLLLSFFLNAYAPNNVTCDTDGPATNTVSNPEPGGGKEDRFRDREYIIGDDVSP